MKRFDVASAEGESGGQERRASAEAHADGVGGWAIKGERGGRGRRASAEGECGAPMCRPYRTRLISSSWFAVSSSPIIQDGSDYNSEYQYQIFHIHSTQIRLFYCIYQNEASCYCPSDTICKQQLPPEIASHSSHTSACSPWHIESNLHSMQGKTNISSDNRFRLNQFASISTIPPSSSLIALSCTVIFSILHSHFRLTFIIVYKVQNDAGCVVG